jgi:hypothetical protein
VPFLAGQGQLRNRRASIEVKKDRIRDVERAAAGRRRGPTNLFYLQAAESRSKAKALASEFIRCRQGQFFHSKAAPTHQVDRNTQVLLYRASQWRKEASHEEKARSKMPFPIGCDGDVASDGFSFFDGIDEGKKEEKARPHLPPASELFPPSDRPR